MADSRPDSEKSMISKIDEAFRFHEQALELRSTRQQMLASNIANADTPGYRAKDIDFNAALTNALSNRPRHAPLMQVTSARHVAPLDQALSTETIYRTPRQASADGNTVELDTERAQFATNAVHYEANLSFLSMQIKQLLAAIQG